MDFGGGCNCSGHLSTLPPAGIICDNAQTCAAVGTFCDPQLGCSDRLVAQDLNDEHSWQLSQEFRLASNFSGPFNFSVGGNYLHYETEENYYVFINSLTLASVRMVTTGPQSPDQTLAVGSRRFRQFQLHCGRLCHVRNPILLNIRRHRRSELLACISTPIRSRSLNNEGHNYFLSQNPYTLNSYAGFGEAYYNVTPDLKLTGGLRWTDDQKHFVDIPSELLVAGLWLSHHRRCGSTVGRIHRTLRGQLDAEARFHRSDAGLCILCARLQGGWRQPARRELWYLVRGVSEFPIPSTH